MKINMKEIQRFAVAGLKHSDYQLIAGLKAGRICKFTWDKDNKYDPNAILITIDGVKVGYVPAKMTEQFHKYRIEKIKLFPIVAAYAKDNPSWLKLFVKVEVRESQEIEPTGYEEFV